MGSTYTGAGFVLRRVLGAVLRDDRGTSPYLYVSKVDVIRIYRISGF
jgi:hypothetical protein